MLKMWAKLVLDNKIMKDCIIDIDENLPVPKMLEDSCRQISYALDLSNPIIQKKHINDILQYHLTKFLPESFIEKVTFDRLELNIFEENPNKQK